MAINPWGDSFTDPPQTIPGPSNPWAACAGADGGTSTKKPDIVIDLPTIEIEVDELKFGTGLALVVLGGTAMLAAAGIFMFAVGVGIGVGGVGGIIAVGVLITIGAFLQGLGLGLSISGGSIMGTAIDPPSIKHNERVVPPSRRKVSVSSEAPRELVDLLHNIYEAEYLTVGEIDLVDRARTAAKKMDAEWYETHLRDLFTVQDRRNHFLREASKNLNKFLKNYGDKLPKIKIDPKVPLRDAINPITEMRSELEKLGIASGEINALLFQIRVPSPVMSSVERSVAALVKESNGDAVALLQRLSKELGEIETIDWDAFGGKLKPEIPKRK